jgi:hypothetical protein
MVPNCGYLPLVLKRSKQVIAVERDTTPSYGEMCQEIISYCTWYTLFMCSRPVKARKDRREKTGGVLVEV